MSGQLLVIPSTFLQRPVQFVQAEDYDTCIAGPQREERLRRMEEQMQSIREFRGEGRTLWERPVSRSLGQRLLPNSDYQNSWIETMWLVIVMVWLHMKVVQLKRTSQVTVMPPHKVKHTTLILLFRISHFFNLRVGDYWLPGNTIYNRQIMALRPFRKGVSLHERR